jgi:HAD superfamily hydrolase (TIGR01549 family)
LASKSANQMFFIVTGTPQSEIDSILHRLAISSYFDRIYGAPTEKTNTIQSEMKQSNLSQSDCLMIGDSETDWLAAKENGIEFWHRSNGDDDFSKLWNGTMLKNFEGIV